VTIFLNKPGTRVIVSASGGGGDEPRATTVQEIGPGWRMFGRTYEEWLALPEGAHETPADYDANHDYPPPGVGKPA
jgi:hypothetical protein